MKNIRILRLVISRLVSRYFKKLVYFSSRKKWFKSSAKKYVGFSVILILLVFTLIKIAPKYHLQPTVSEGIIGVYTKNNLPLVVSYLLSDSLVKLDKNGQPEPNLAEKWDVSGDAKVYTFKLKHDLFWNDGSKIKSSEIKFNLPDVEVSYPDERTIIFKLADSFSPFPTLLINPVFKENSLVGTGRFMVSNVDLSKNIVTKLYLTPIKDKSLPTLTVRFYQDEKVAKTAFELGEIESLIGISESGGYSGEGVVTLKKITNFNKVVGVFYNTKDAILSDKNLRRALSYASPKIDGEEIARGPILPFSWAYNTQLKEYTADKNAAKTYLNKVSSGKDKTITLTTIPALSSLGEKIVQSWKQLGLQAVLRVESGVPQNFQALLISQPIQVDPDQYSLWHSTQVNTNVSKYSSPRIDKDLEDGRKTSDENIRKEKYLDFQRVLMDDSPATFLYYPKTNIILRKRVENNLNKILNLQIQ